MSEAREWHHEVREPTTLVEALAGATGLSKRSLKDVLRKGAVWLTRGKGTRRVRRAKAPLRAGDVVHLYHDPRVLEAEPPPARLVADEGSYSVWDKPRGMLSQGSKWGDHCTIGRWSEAHLQPQRSSFPVHRLDRATRGLILVAHSKRAARELSGLFSERSLTKVYEARVEGSPEADELLFEAPLDGRPARTRALVRERLASGEALLEVHLDTGRKHQIRRHLSEAGWPIVGDRLYGRGHEGGADLQLSAVRLGFECPLTGETKRYDLFNLSP